jgi:hypothetical protein
MKIFSRIALLLLLCLSLGSQKVSASEQVWHEVSYHVTFGGCQWYVSGYLDENNTGGLTASCIDGPCRGGVIWVGLTVNPSEDATNSYNAHSFEYQVNNQVVGEDEMGLPSITLWEGLISSSE